MSSASSHRWLLVTSVLALLIGSAGASTAAPGDIVDPLAGLSPAELVDLQLVADMDGTSLEQAAAEFAWQDDFALMATELEEQFPAEFAGAEIVDAAGRVAAIAFKGRVPTEALARTTAFGLADVRVTGGTGHSVRELDERVAAVHAAVAGRRDLVSDVVSTYDPDTGAITVEAAPSHPAGQGGSDDEVLVERLWSGLPEAARRHVAAIRITAAVANRSESALGGGRIERTNDYRLACTTGFSARTASGIAGIVTAGHCSNSTTYEDYSGAAEVAMGLGGPPGGDWGDFQFQTTSTTEVDDFYYNKGVTRDVTGIANPTSGQRLCKFGHAYGVGCAYVQDLSACATDTAEGVTYTACRLVRTDNDISEGGDSGGPWYYGNTAYGIHWGTFSTWLGERSAFSRTTYVDEALNGVTILR